MSCFVKPTVKTPKIFSLLGCKPEKSSKLSQEEKQQLENSCIIVLDKNYLWK